MTSESGRVGRSSREHDYIVSGPGLTGSLNINKNVGIQTVDQDVYPSLLSRILDPSLPQLSLSHRVDVSVSDPESNVRSVLRLVLMFL